MSREGKGTGPAPEGSRTGTAAEPPRTDAPTADPRSGLATFADPRSAAAPADPRSAAGAFVAGLLFAVGLALAEMTNPARIFGFLDLFGHWDPTLVFVMAGAVTVHFALARLVLRRPAPLFGLRFERPSRTGIDARLVVGAALFGVGWGLGGYCPGPALVGLTAGRPAVLLFVGAMLGGLALGGALVSRSRGGEADGPACG